MTTTLAPDGMGAGGLMAGYGPDDGDGCGDGRVLGEDIDSDDGEGSAHRSIFSQTADFESAPDGTSYGRSKYSLKIDDPLEALHHVLP